LISKLYVDQTVELKNWARGRQEVWRLEEVLNNDAVSLILFNFYSKYLTNEVLEGFGDFKIGGQVIRTEKYVDDLVLLRRKRCYRACLINEL
jgi:hypothetical protein